MKNPKRHQRFRSNRDQSYVAVRWVDHEQNLVFFYEVQGLGRRGETELPIDAFLKAYTLDESVSPEVLDAEWKRVAQEGGPTDGYENTKFMRLVDAHERVLEELRDFARESLATSGEPDPVREKELKLLKAELNNVEPDPSAGADVNLHDVEVDPDTGRLLH